jgi:PST family polysaccharide transporter
MKKAKDLKMFLYLGVTTLYASLLENIVNIIAKSSILKGFGMDYLGYYQVSIGITLVYVGFITGSISNDYYPRLIDKVKDGIVTTNSFVNNQISISMHLIMPLLLIFLAYGSYFIEILFSSDFLPAEELMSYSIAGTLFRVISWPIVYVFLAHKNKKIYFYSEFIGNFSHLLLIILAVYLHSFEWLGIAYLIHYIIYIVFVIAVYFNHFNGEIESSNVIFFLINISVIFLLVLGKLFVKSYAFTVAPILILFMLYMGRKEYEFILQSIVAKVSRTR